MHAVARLPAWAHPIFLRFPTVNHPSAMLWDPSSTLLPLYCQSGCSRITKLRHRVWRAEVLHQQGRCLLVEPWLPLHQRLVQKLHAISSQFGLLRPLQQPPIAESTCKGVTGCRYQIQAWSWVIRQLRAAAPKHHDEGSLGCLSGVKSLVSQAARQFFTQAQDMQLCVNKPVGVVMCLQAACWGLLRGRLAAAPVP